MSRGLRSRSLVNGELAGLLGSTRCDDGDVKGGISEVAVAGGRQRANQANRSLLAVLFAGLTIGTVLRHSKRHAERSKSSKSMRLVNGNEAFRPGEEFLDVDGMAINAHGGGVLHFNDSYYWYGEIKSGATYL